jgi:hypothetical protein
VAGTAEADREHGDQLDVVAVGLLLVVLDRPVRLHRTAQVRAAGIEGGEARLALELAVVADEHRAAGDLADLRVLEVGGDHELALGEVLDRPEVDVLLLLVRESGQHGEAEHGQRQDAADDTAEAERRGGEEGAARVRHRLVGGRRGR